MTIRDFRYEYTKEELRAEIENLRDIILHAAERTAQLEAVVEAARRVHNEDIKGQSGVGNDFDQIAAMCDALDALSSVLAVLEQTETP